MSNQSKTSDFILNAAAPDDGEDDGVTEAGAHLSGAPSSSQSGTIPSGSEGAQRGQACCMDGKIPGKGDGGGGRAGNVNCS